MPLEEMYQSPNKHHNQLSEIQEMQQADEMSYKSDFERKEAKMSSDNVSDKVNINVGEGYGHGHDGGGQAAMIAALLNGRNQSDPGMIAALANHHGNDGFGGGNGIWALLLLSILGRRGFGGGDDGCSNGHIPVNTVSLQALQDIKASIPTNALEIQNALQQQLSTLLLAGQQSAANTKDAIQATNLGLLTAIEKVNQNVLEQGCQTRAVVIESKNEVLVQMKNDRISELESRLARVEGHGHARETEVNVVQQVNQQQQQQQFQAQLSGLLATCQALMVQNSRQAQDIVNLGTMTASGTQAAANTQVR